MSYWIIPISEKIIVETTVQHVSLDDMLEPDIAAQIKAFDQTLTEFLYNTNFVTYDFNYFGVEYEGSDMPQLDTWGP